MRKINRHKYFNILLLSLVTCMNQTSCTIESNEEMNPNNIYGDWILVSHEYREYVNGELCDEDNTEYTGFITPGVRFDKDGNFDLLYNFGGTLSSLSYGSYSYEDREISLIRDIDTTSEYVLKVTTLTSQDLVLTYIDRYTENNEQHIAISRYTLQRLDKNG